MSALEKKRGIDIFQSQINRKRQKVNSNSYFRIATSESGLVLQNPPDKCLLDEDGITFTRKLKSKLLNNINYPLNISEYIKDFEQEIDDSSLFSHFVFSNVVRTTEAEEVAYKDSVLKMILNVSIIQEKIITAVFDKVYQIIGENYNMSVIQTLLKIFTGLDSIENQDKLISNLINVLDISDDRALRLEIISAIPDIVGDQIHDNIATEISRFLSEEHELIPVILDCLSFLSLSVEKYLDIQNKILQLIRSSPKFTYFPNLVKFVLLPEKMNDASSLQIIESLRLVLNWDNIRIHSEDIPTNQVLTANAIYDAISASKQTANTFLKSIQLCKLESDHKPLDIIILVLLYKNDLKQKVINIIKKHVKLHILTINVIKNAFNCYRSMLKQYLYPMLELVNSLLRLQGDKCIVEFASQWYISMYTNLEEQRSSIIGELLLTGLSGKQYFMGMIYIFKEIGATDLSSLKGQSLKLLTLLDRLDGVEVNEIREVMSLLCALAYKFNDSGLKDDIQMLVRKQLSSSDKTNKLKGIISSVQSVRYLMINTDKDDGESNDDVDYSSYDHFKSGPNKEAARLIEYTARSTRHFSDLTIFFYDEMANVVKKSDYINETFLLWLVNAVTNDLQSNFIVDEIHSNVMNGIKVNLQYGINSDEELDDFIAINIAGLFLSENEDQQMTITTLPALFQLVQVLHFKKSGELTSIDALLGCPIILPEYSESYNPGEKLCMVDCYILCINWFRELINGFAGQTDESLKKKVFERILNVEHMQSKVRDYIGELKPSKYFPPICLFDNNAYPMTKTNVGKSIKRNSDLENKTLNETSRSNIPPTSVPTSSKIINDKLNLNNYMRRIHNNIMCLLKEDFDISSEDINNLEILNFIYTHVDQITSVVLTSKIVKKKIEHENTVDTVTNAKHVATVLSELMPNILSHIDCIVVELMNEMSNEEEKYSIKQNNIQLTLQLIIRALITFFRWNGFTINENIALLKSSLRIVALKQESEVSKIISLKDLLILNAKYFKKYLEYFKNIALAVDLLDLIYALFKIYENDVVVEILNDLSNEILSQIWYFTDGIVEKGLVYNQHIDSVMGTFFSTLNIDSIKRITTQVFAEIDAVREKPNILPSFKSITKANFPILYKHIITACAETVKREVDKKMTYDEYLLLWKDVAIILKLLSEVAKTLENRSNFSVLLKKSQPIIKLFISHGMPIVEIKLKNKTDFVIEVLKLMQHSTRFLQTLCCHSRLKKDAALISKVPQIRLLLETLIYKVKAVLVANHCSEAFWMGNLKNKNLQGEVIPSQETVNEEPDDSEELPVDESAEESNDEEHLSPDSKSVSDII